MDYSGTVVWVLVLSAVVKLLLLLPLLVAPRQEMLAKN